MSLQETISHQPFKTSFYYGWIIVAISSLGMFFSGPGQTYSISVFIDSYIRDFDLSRSVVSSIYSTATLLAGMLLFIVGRFIDRFGQRKMMLIVGLLLGFACFWNSAITGPVMMFLGIFMLRLFGQGSMTLLPNTLVPQWFILKRGRAFSFMAIGGFVSSASFPLINAWMITEWSWQIAWLVWGVLLCLFFVPLAYFFIRNKPEDIGLLPDNASRLKQQRNKMEQNKGGNYEVSWTLKSAMRTRAFWLILFCVSIPAMINTGLTFHLVSILGNEGLKTTTAALILSLMGVVGFPVTMVSGFLLEKFKVHKVLALLFIGQLLLMLILYNVHSFFLAIVFGVVWGLIGGLERITLTIIWPNYFGRKHIGSIKSIAQTTMIIGSALGPLPFGVAYDLFGGYEEIMLIMMIFPVLGMIAAFISPPPKQNTTP